MDILTDLLGMSVCYTKWNKTKALPFYLTSGYEFQKAEIEGCFCIFLCPKGDELPTLPALKKQILRIQKEEMLPVVLRVRTMSAFRRKNMIENKIPFVIEEKQAYLPFMGTFLQAKADAAVKNPEKFMVSSQVLFLMYMYQREEKLYLADAARMLPYSAMTITRAAKQLEESGLFAVKKEGVNKILLGKAPKKELYEEAFAYLNSPVMKKGFLLKEAVTDEMLMAGTTALAEKTILNGEILLEYATDKTLFSGNDLEKELVDPHKQAEVEVWKYPPQLFGRDGMVDTISLALSLKENKDERVETAVEEMMAQLWRNLDGNRI